jgi:DNA-directed RNA polymerase subunit RPC12/RpoP
MADLLEIECPHCNNNYSRSAARVLIKCHVCDNEFEHECREGIRCHRCKKVNPTSRGSCVDCGANISGTYSGTRFGWIHDQNEFVQAIIIGSGVLLVCLLFALMFI